MPECALTFRSLGGVSTSRRPPHAEIRNRGRFQPSLATPALAAQYYVALDSSTKQCQVVAQKPDGTSMKMVGSGAYKSEADAEKAIQSLTECNS